MIDIEFSFDDEEVINAITGIQANLEAASYILDDALSESLDEVVDYAQVYAPVDTGRLRDSIRKEKVGELEYMLICDPKNPTNGESYGGYVEYGTSLQEAQPFMRPALWAVYPKMVERIQGELADIFIIQDGRVRDVWGRFRAMP